jgi:hypothetical protein
MPHGRWTKWYKEYFNNNRKLDTIDYLLIDMLKPSSARISAADIIERIKKTKHLLNTRYTFTRREKDVQVNGLDDDTKCEYTCMGLEEFCTGSYVNNNECVLLSDKLDELWDTIQKKYNSEQDIQRNFDASTN